MDSNENGERKRAAQTGPSASVIGVLARHYADQRERRAAALAAVLGAEDQRAAGAGEPSRCDRPNPAQNPPSGADVPGPELIALMWRAQLAFAVCVLRQLQQQMLLAEDDCTALFDLTAAARAGVEGFRPCQDRAVAAARAYFRGLADLSLQEARALQLELERAGDGLQSAIGERPADGLGHKRRWRVKR